MQPSPAPRPSRAPGWRLAREVDQLRRAAKSIREALGPATLRLPYLTPEVAALTRLADQIDVHATALEAD